MNIQTQFAIGLFCLGTVVSSFAQTNEAVTPAKRVELFDGKSLAGWSFVSKGTNGEASAIWSVTNGVIHCVGKPNGYARTVQAFKDYQLHAEWRFPEGAGNSGVFLHITGEDKVWPMCVEAQLASEHAGDIRFNGGSTEKGSPLFVKAVPRRRDSSEKPVGEWNSYDIVCRSNSMTLRVNGVLQNEIGETTVTEGSIGLQAEGKAIEFRNIWVEPLAKP